MTDVMTRARERLARMQQRRRLPFFVAMDRRTLSGNDVLVVVGACGLGALIGPWDYRDAMDVAVTAMPVVLLVVAIMRGRR